MGITITYQGRLKNPNCLRNVLDVIKHIADSHFWRYEEIAAGAISSMVQLDRNQRTYSSITMGVLLSPHPEAEPMRIEFDENLYMEDCVDTLYAGALTHVRLISLFRLVKKYFAFLVIEDAGELWETDDLDTLQWHLEEAWESELALDTEEFAGGYRCLEFAK